MNLSPHFTLAEFLVSQEAARRGIDNTPSPEVVARLTRTALALEAVRIRLGVPIIVSSGYRCPALNAAVKGARDSAHITGDAVDFIAPKFGGPATVVSALVDAGIEFDQLIEEHGPSGWVHLSFAAPMRRQVLRIDSAGTRPWGA